MREKRFWQELSAYLDGESADGERIGRLIQKDSRVARRYMELRKLSSHLKALPETEPHPAFVTRVMGGVQEVSQVARGSWARKVFAAAVTVCAVLVVSTAVFMGAWNWRPAAHLSRSNEEVLLAVDTEVLTDAIAARPERAEGLYDITAHSYINDIAEYPPSEELLDVLACADWLDSVATAFEAQDDLDAIVGALDETDAKTFRELLMKYATEELKT